MPTIMFTRHRISEVMAEVNCMASRASSTTCISARHALSISEGTKQVIGPKEEGGYRLRWTLACLVGSHPRFTAGARWGLDGGQPRS